jgi:hypothetical protein
MRLVLNPHTRTSAIQQLVMLCKERGDKDPPASSGPASDSDSDKTSPIVLPLVLNFGFQLHKGDKCDCLDSCKKTWHAVEVTERDTTHVRVRFNGGEPNMGCRT